MPYCSIASGSVLAINKTVWDSLAAEDRDAIRRAARSSYQTLGSVMASSLEAQLDDLRKAGATVRILEPGEVSRWSDATRYREVQSAWAKDQISKGVYGAGPALDAVTAIMADVMG